MKKKKFLRKYGHVEVKFHCIDAGLLYFFGKEKRGSRKDFDVHVTLDFRKNLNLLEDFVFDRSPTQIEDLIPYSDYKIELHSTIIKSGKKKTIKV